MASCAVVTNIAPKTIENDRGAKQKQKAAENASKADEIQHGREMKVKYIYYILTIREGLKKNQLWKIPYRVLTPPLPPLLWKNFFIFFSETRPFFENFL